MRAVLGPVPASQLQNPDTRRELHQAHELHPDDHAALERELGRIYAERQIRPGRACLPGLVRGGVAIAINRLPLPFLSEPRTLADLLAGTKLVRRRSRWRRTLGRGDTV
jgi:hypothetical protein